MKKIGYWPALALLCLGPQARAQTWVERWSGDPSRGLDTFEGVESDRANSHPGFEHITAAGTDFRFDMHMRDRDGSDRQRHEVKGMNVPGQGDIIIRQGETWRFAYQMFMPTTLTGGSRFTHIHQQKMVSDAGSSGGPLATLSTGLRGSTEVLVLRALNPGGDFNPIPLAPLRNKWIDVELEYKFDTAGNGGRVRMVVRSGGATVTDATKTGVNLWANEGARDRRVRPKWGIYRSLGSSGLKETFLLLRNMKAFQLTTGTPPPPPPPPPDRHYFWHEAENGTLSAPMQSLVDPNASGGRYVRVAAGNNSNASAPASGHTQVAFDVTVAGSYRVWARVIAANPGDDSFWVRIDEGPWIRWNEVALGTAWHWDQVHDSDNSDRVVTVPLTAARHTLTVAYREDGTQLDKLLITNDADFVPTGAGQ